MRSKGGGGGGGGEGKRAVFLPSTFSPPPPPPFILPLQYSSAPRSAPGSPRPDKASFWPGCFIVLNVSFPRVAVIVMEGVESNCGVTRGEDRYQFLPTILVQYTAWGAENFTTGYFSWEIDSLQFSLHPLYLPSGMWTESPCFDTREVSWRLRHAVLAVVVLWTLSRDQFSVRLDFTRV